MLDDSVTRRVILTTKEVKLEEIDRIVEAHIPGQMRPSMGADTVKNEYENVLRYPMEMLKTSRDGSALPKSHALSQERI